MLKVTYLSILLLLLFNEMWIRAVQPLLLIDGRDFFLFFSSSCDAKHQSGARQPNRSRRPQQDATPHSVDCNFNRCLRSQGGMPRGWGCQRPSFPWGHQQHGSPHVCPSRDSAWANLTFLSTALLLHPHLQHPVPKLFRFKPLLPHVAMQKKLGDSFTSLQTTLVATYCSVIYSPIAQMEVR